MVVNVGAMAFQKFGEVIGDSISAARESNQVAAQTAQVIKSTGEAAGVTAQHVLDYASSLSAASGKSLFGDEQIAQSTNLLLTFTQIKGATLDAATAISVDMAQALGGAPKDAAIQLGKALNDPVKGITALTRVGVTFSDEQKDMIKAMTEAGDTAGAQQVILNELNKEFGGSAAAAAKADGGFAQFQDRLGEMEETIGKAILPVLGQLLGILNDSLLPVIENAANQIGPFIESLQPMISTIQVLITGLINSFANTSPLDTFSAASGTMASLWQTQLQPAFDAVVTVLKTQVWPILQDLGTALFPLVGASTQILAGFWTDVLVPAVQLLWSILTTVVLPIIAQLASWLKDVLPPAIQATADFFTNTLFPILHQVYDWINANVIPILQVLAQWLMTNVPIAVQAATDFFMTVLLPAIQSIWAFINDNVFPLFASLWAWLATTIPAALQTLANFWNQTLLPAINAVWSFINTFVIPIFVALANVYIALVKKEIELLTALWANVLLPAITSIWNFIKINLGPIFQWLTDTVLAPVLKMIQDIATYILTTMTPWLKALAQLVSSEVGDAFKHLQSWGSAAVGALHSIGDAVQSVISWLSDLASKISSIAIPSWLQGHSPPPMADWFSYIGGAVGALNAQLPALQANLSAQIGPQGQSITNTASTRSFTYAPNISTTGNVDAPMDMALASSLASV